MLDNWIPVTEAIGRLAHAKEIQPDKAILALMELGLNGRVSGRVDKVVEPSNREPQRAVDMMSQHWKRLEDTGSGQWFRESEAYFSDEDFWLGIRVHAADLERETGELAPADYTSWATEFAPQASYVTLFESVSWIAFRKIMNEDQIRHSLSGHGGEDKANALAKGLRELIDLACAHDMQGGQSIALKKRCLEQASDGEIDIFWRDIEREDLQTLRELDLQSAMMPPGSNAAPQAMEADSEPGSEPTNEQEKACNAPEISVSDFRVSRNALFKHFSPEQPAALKQVIATEKAVTQCEAWLHQQFSNENNQGRAKPWFRERAIGLYEGKLTVRGFDRAWAKVAPGYGFTAAGRKRKS